MKKLHYAIDQLKTIVTITGKAHLLWDSEKNNYFISLVRPFKNNDFELILTIKN